MKISIISDCHLNKALYKGVMDKDYPTIPFRTADHMRSFNWAITNAIEEDKPELIIITGDVFDSFNPSNEVRHFFFKQIRRIKDAKISLIILVGNHDVCRRNHALQGIDELAGNSVKIIDDPKIISFKDHVLLLFPYPMVVERKEKTIRQAFHDFVDDFHSKKEGFVDKTVLFFGHFSVQGATMSRYLSHKEDEFTKSMRPVINNDVNDLTLTELDSIGASHIFLGDYHEHQILKCETPSMYVGSLEKTNILESNQSKGYVLYDSDMEPHKKMGKSRFVEYPNCRPMIDLQGNFKDIESNYGIYSESSEGAIVRISFEGSRSELVEFSNNLDALKERISQEIKPIYIYHNQKVVDEEAEKQANMFEQELVKKGHIEADDVKHAVVAMIKEKVTCEDEQGVLIDMAQEIYDETMGLN